MFNLIFQLFNEIDDVHPSPRSNEAINRRDCLDEFVGASLGIASGGDDPLARLLSLCQLSQYLTRFFPCGLNESAGVDNQQIGCMGTGSWGIASASEECCDALAVDQVLRASKR